MADLEQQNEEFDVDDTLSLEDDSIEDNDIKSSSEDDTEEEVTYDDYHTERQKREKAEKTLVKYKRQLKEMKANNTQTDSDVLTKTDYKIMSFIKDNPTYNWCETQFKDYLSKGLSFDEAKKLVEPNKALENRQKLKSSSITGGETSNTKTSYTQAELENMSQAEYNKVMDLVDNWKASIE